jgi:hypothetical protein
MHNKCYLFADRAIEYIRDTRLRLSQPDLDSDDQPSDASSFSSGVYSMTASEASSDPDEPSAPTVSGRRVGLASSCRNQGSKFALRNRRVQYV